MVTRNMVLFTIGPVQPFIAQARKTRDLWAGSFLLSDLMQAAMSHLKDKKDSVGRHKLVFPFDPSTSGKIPDLPNKFVAILDSEKEATDAADAAERLLRTRWDEIAGAVWGYLEKDAPAIKAARGVWDLQVRFEHFFEVYWAIAPEQPGERKEEPYGDWFTRTQQALDARKRLRNFVQQDEPEPGEKSTISGERQALHGGKADAQGVKDFWAGIAERFSAAQVSHDGSERLDAIDAIKRFAMPARAIPELPFPSTSTVAAAPFLVSVLGAVSASPLLQGALQSWEQFTQPSLDKGADPRALPYLERLAGSRRALLHRDGDSLFPETFTPERLKENYGLDPTSEDSRKLVRQAPEILRSLRQAAEKEELPPLTPYYAVLVMDGDHMGALLSNVADRDAHRNISGALSRFSREEALTLVEQGDYPAKLVYAGGDDVLALAPLRGVLPLSDALQERYRNVIVQHKPKGYEEQKVTMSAGIAIAHYLDPLSHVLREARRAEDQAKKRYRRNAVVVKLLRRSGEPTTVGCKWRYDGLSLDAQPLALFERLRKLLDEAVISTGFVYTLAEEAAALSLLSRPAQASEIRRLLLRGRSTIREKRDKLPDDDLKALAEGLATLAEAMNPPATPEGGTLEDDDEVDEEDQRNGLELWGVGPRRGLVEMSGWLLLMAFSLRGGRD